MAFKAKEIGKTTAFVLGLSAAATAFGIARAPLVHAQPAPVAFTF